MLKLDILNKDKGFPEHLTLFERCIQFKKFKFANMLLEQGEGYKLHYDSLTKFLLIENSDIEKNKMSQEDIDL